MKILGTIQFWSEARRFGIITSRNSDNSVDRYYLQYSTIIAGKEIPEVGDTVRFVVRPGVVPSGRLPVACEVEILTPETAGVSQSGPATLATPAAVAAESSTVEAK